jgi:hypothetical protein
MQVGSANLLNWAQTILRSTLHLVREPADQRGFAVIPGRWAVERTSAWLTRTAGSHGTANATPPRRRP